MSEIATPAAEAVATPAVPETVQGATPATPDAAALPVETAEAAAEKPDQPRDAEGKFLPNNPRVIKLQETINDLTRQKHDTAREVARLRAEAETLTKRLKDAPQIDPADFEGQTAHQVKRALAEERLEDTTRRIDSLNSQAQQATENIIAAQIDAMKEAIPDIERIVLPPSQGGPGISPIMAEAISRQENGALIAYHLMKNPRENARILSADPLTQALEIGRIAAQVKPAPVKRVSQAPQPVQTVSGSPGNPAPDLASLDFKAYEKLRNDQELARR